MPEYIVTTVVRVSAESPTEARAKSRDVKASTTRVVLANGQVPIVTQAKNVVKAVGQAIKNPTPVSKEEQERRLGICKGTVDTPKCDFYLNGRCLKCGCYVNWKSRLEAWHCPIQKW